MKDYKKIVDGIKLPIYLFCAVVLTVLVIHIYERNNYVGCSFDCVDCTKNVTSYGVDAGFLLKQLDSREELVNFGISKGYPDGCVYTGSQISCYRYIGTKTESEKFYVMTDFAEYLIKKYN